jgi:hypothetical protein
MSSPRVSAIVPRKIALRARRIAAGDSGAIYPAQAPRDGRPQDRGRHSHASGKVSQGRPARRRLQSRLVSAAKVDTLSP